MLDDTHQMLRELSTLQVELSTLDEQIQTISDHSSDALAVQRFKKRRAWLKERIQLLEDMIHPDIIA